jgi:hypothetical protein
MVYFYFCRNTIYKKMRAIILFLFQILSMATVAQHEIFRSNDLELGNAELDGIADDQNAVVSIRDKGDYILCLIHNGIVFKSSRMKYTELILRGIRAKDDAIYVYFWGNKLGDLKEYVLTFFMDETKRTNLDWNGTDGKVLFCFTNNEGFNKIICNKKKGLIYLETFDANIPKSLKQISISDRSILKDLLDEPIEFMAPNNSNYKKISTLVKAFEYNGQVSILIDNSWNSTHPETKLIELDFNDLSAVKRTLQLAIPRGMKHTSYDIKNHIFTWCINSEGFQLLIHKKDSLKLKKAFVYNLYSSKIELKRTPVYYSISANGTDREMSWRDPILKYIDESKIKDMLKFFSQDDPAFKVSEENESFRILFGTYESATNPSTRYMAAGPTAMRSVSMQAGKPASKKFFFSFLNPDFTVSQNNSFGYHKELTIDRRSKEVLDLEKISEMTQIINDKKSYLVYLLKKGKELVIEEL